MQWPATDTVGPEGWALPTAGNHGRGGRGSDQGPACEGGAGMSDIVQIFADGAIRKALAGKQRATLPMEVILDNPSPARSLSATGENARLRHRRYQAWRKVDTLKDYWQARMDFNDATARSAGSYFGRLVLSCGRPRRPVAIARKLSRGLCEAAPDTGADYSVGELEEGYPGKRSPSKHRRDNSGSPPELCKTLKDL
jgi:hypothetical protein